MRTLSPASIAELSSHLQQAHRDRMRVRVLGRNGPDEAARPNVDLTISLAGLAASIEHVPGDLIATIPAGVTLGDANRRLRENGQWLPLDPHDAGHLTIGAVVAGNESGPRRHRYGSPRDLIIGIEMVLADGRVAKAGGRVVKNVAGYDLARLMCGSLGSLAIITSATFKLFPIPATSRTVAIHMADTTEMGRLVQAISAAPLTPSTIELLSPPHGLLVRFETTPSAGEAQARAVVELSERLGARCRVATDDDESAIWTKYEQQLFPDAGTLFRMSVLPSRVPSMVEAIAAAASSHGVGCSIGGRAALGVLHARLDDRDAAHDAVVGSLRQRVGADGGSLVVTRATSPIADRWGPMGDAWPLMQSVKARFDPGGILNPGGGPGEL